MKENREYGNPFLRQGKQRETYVFTQGIYHQHRENFRVEKKRACDFKQVNFTCCFINVMKIFDDWSPVVWGFFFSPD